MLILLHSICAVSPNKDFCCLQQANSCIYKTVYRDQCACSPPRCQSPHCPLHSVNTLGLLHLHHCQTQFPSVETWYFKSSQLSYRLNSPKKRSTFSALKSLFMIENWCPVDFIQFAVKRKNDWKPATFTALHGNNDNTRTNSSITSPIWCHHRCGFSLPPAPFFCWMMRM